MLKSLNARLQHLIALWGCITCLRLITTCKNGQLFYNKGIDLIASMVVMGDVDLYVVSFEEGPCGIGLRLLKMNDELHNCFCMVIAQNGFKKKKNEM
jgi:hypothetical protein